MKRFYKFLMPLVMIVALALPVSVAAQTTCQITIVGEDDYGDGWNGGSLTITQGTTTVGTFTISDGSTGTQTFTVSSDTSVTFSWTAGQYDDEVTINIYDGGGAMVFTVTEPNSGTIYTMNTPCPSCIAPAGLAVTVTGSDADITWTEGDGSAWEIVWGTGSFDPDTVTINTDNASSGSYSLTNLSDGSYTAYVRTDCGSDGYSAWMPISFYVNANGCVIVINGHDSFGDGWNGGSLAVVQGGVTVQTVTMSSGSSVTATIPVTTDPISFVWTSGSYDSEVSFTISNANNVVLFSASQPSAGTVFSMSNPCSNCFAPSDVHLTNVTSDEASLTWGGDTNATYGIIWGTSADVASDNGTSETASTNSITFNNLTSGTGYTVMVWVDCGNGETSDTVTFTFATIGDAVDEFPYTTGFEATDDIAWSFVNDGTNKWAIGSATNNGGTSSLYVSNDNGTSNTYSTSGAQFSYAYRVFVISDPAQYAISFDWKGYGESNYDYLRAWIAPGSAASGLTAGQTPDGGTSAYNYTTATPTGWIDLGGKMNLSNNWQTAQALPTLTAGSYLLVFMWANDGSGGTNPPAAVDNIVFSALTCSQPQNLTVTNLTSDTIALAWNAGGSEAAWEITNGIDTVEVYDSAYVFDNLSANTNYTIKIRSICGTDDTSMWLSMSVRTACGAITTLPWGEDFNALSVSSSSMIPCWEYMGGGYVATTSSYSVSGNGLGFYPSSSSSNDHILVLPDFDTATSGLELSIWIRPETTSGSSGSFSLGYVRDVDSASSFVETLHLESTQMTTTFTRYKTTFPTAPDSARIALRHNVNSTAWYWFIDDITVSALAPCPNVDDITVQAGPTSAVVSWTSTGNTYTGATVEYRDTTSATWNTLNVTGQNYAIITGLTSETYYEVRVASNCVDDVTGNFINSSFSTTAFPCAQFDSTSLINVTVGTGATTNSYIPSTSFYNYGYSQQFFKASEIGASGVITSITLYPSAITQQRTYEIYMAQTNDTAAASFINPNGLTCVYNGGHIQLTAGQPVTFDLTTPFNYSNSSNLLLIFRDMTGTYVSGNNWQGDNAWTNASCYVYQDGGAYTPGSVSGGTASTFRNKVSFFGGTCLQASTCAAPIPIVTDVTTTTVDVAWAPGNTETSWRVYYRNVNDANFTLAGTATTNSYQFTGLASGMPHEFMVVPICADSLPATIQATTECATISSLPLMENFNNWGTGTGHMPNCWYRTGCYSTYSYISGSYNMSGTTGGSVYMYQSGSSHSTFFLPALDTNVIQANQTQLVFNVFYTTSSYMNPAIEVGVLSDPEDITTFVPVDTVFHTNGINSWQIFEVPLANYTGNGAYVGIRTANNPYSTGQYTYSYFYLDDLTLEMIPTCPRPDSLTAANATINSVDLGWHERGNATEWMIEYGPLGFQLGTGTTVIANANPFTLTGIPSAYQGEFYVKSICGQGDTGDYSRQPLAFNTTQIPATLPYNYDFEDPTEWANWQTSSNSTTNTWFRGTAVADSGNYSMYMSADNGATYRPYSYNAVVNAAAYRDIDFGPIDSSYTISFRARVGGTIDANYDGMMVFLVDPALPTVPSNSNITSPWGNVNDLYRIATVRRDTTWQTYEASFDTIHGVHRVAFFWFNQNTTSYANLIEPAAVDNIHIDYSTCPRPLNLDAAPSNTSTLLTWQGAPNATYQVAYRIVNGTNQYVTTNNNSITLTGLTPNSDYYAWVRKLCSVGDTSLWSDGVAFTTTLCDGATEATNFDPNGSMTTSTYTPIGYSLYNYSYVQTIIDSADLTSLGGDISAFAFNAGTITTGSTYFNNMTVYLSNVSENNLSNGFIHPDATHEFVKVIDSASFNFSEDGWHIHNFDTVFTWDGHSNILLSVKRDNGSYSGSQTFVAHAASAIKSRYIYQDSGPYDINTVNGGSTTTTVGNVRLISCGAGCAAPSAMTTTGVTYNAATVTWSGSDSTEIGIHQGLWDETGVNFVTVTNHTYTFTGLTPNTQYTVAARTLCEDDMTSNWTFVTFTTEDLPCFAPSNIQVSNQTTNGGKVTWTPGGNETEWLVNVFRTGVIDTNYTVINTPMCNVSGLYADMTYTVRVASVCGGIETVWCDSTATLTTTACLPPTNVEAVANGHNAMVTWTSSGANEYHVLWYLEGFTTGADSVVVTNGTTNATITGLEQGETYDIYVYAYCDGQRSAQAGRTQVTITGIDDVNSSLINLYPNPANTTVTVDGIQGEAIVTIVDMNGRTVFSEKAVGKLTIDLNGMAQGAYFVRITGENTTAIRKLIVK